MQKDLLSEAFQSNKDIDELAKLFKVSSEAMGYRLNSKFIRTNIMSIDTKDADIFSESNRNKIKSIQHRVSSEELDAYQIISEIENRRYVIKLILNAWRAEQKQDRGLKNFYAKRFLYMVALEILFTATLIVLIGLGIMHLSKWTLNIFTTGVISQSVSVVLIIVKYLFPDTKLNILELLRENKHGKD